MTWLHFAVLALAAFRVTRFVAWDEITTTPRTWVSGLSDHEYARVAKFAESERAEGRDPWPSLENMGVPIGERRYYIAKLLHCPWCVGFWISGALTLLVGWHDHVSWTYGLGVWLAVSSIVGLVAKNLDP